MRCWLETIWRRGYTYNVRNCLGERVLPAGDSKDEAPLIQHDKKLFARRTP
jgi:hypothetical protein